MSRTAVREADCPVTTTRPERGQRRHKNYHYYDAGNCDKTGSGGPSPLRSWDDRRDHHDRLMEDHGLKQKT